MFSGTVSISDVATASQYNNLRKDAGLFSGDDVDITYDTQGRVSTVVHNDYSVTLTITYNSDDTISSVTDGTDTWNFTYNAQGQLTDILKA